MTKRLVSRSAGAKPVHGVYEGELSTLPDGARLWVEASGFKPAAGSVMLVPGEGGAIAGAVLGLGKRGALGPAATAMLSGALAQTLPAGEWAIESSTGLDPDLSALGFVLGSYRFERYLSATAPTGPTLALPQGADEAGVRRAAEASFLVRDLVNTPTNDLGPDAQRRRVIFGKQRGA